MQFRPAQMSSGENFIGAVFFPDTVCGRLF